MKYSHTYEEYVNMKNSIDTNQYDKINLEIKNTRSLISTLKSEKDKENLSLNKIKNQCKSVNSSIKKLFESNKNLSFEDNISEKIIKLNDELIDLKTEGKMKKNQYDDLKNKKISKDECRNV